jgi:hypothetical protein
MADRRRRELHPLDQTISSLEFVTVLLRVMGLLLLLSTIATIVLVAIFTVDSHSVKSTTTAPGSATRHEFSTWLLVWTGANMFLSAAYDRVRNYGDGIFIEISDEIQWFIRKGESNGGDSAGDVTPQVKYRMALRNFTTVEDLPVIPGKYGPLAYIAVNAAILLTMIIISLGS